MKPTWTLEAGWWKTIARCFPPGVDSLVSTIAASLFVGFPASKSLLKLGVCLFSQKTIEKKAAVLLSGTLLGSIFNQDIQLHFPFLLP